MNGILSNEGRLTDEKFAFLERESLNVICELHVLLQETSRWVLPKDPLLAASLVRAADSLLENETKGALIPVRNVPN